MATDSTLCLFCCSTAGDNDKSSNEDIQPGRSNYILTTHLNVMFILKKLLEVPASSLETYLVCCGAPDSWISMCLKCKVLVKEAYDIHSQMMQFQKQFRLAQKKIISIVKQSEKERNRRTFKNKNGSFSIMDLTRNFVLLNRYGFLDPSGLRDSRTDSMSQYEIMERNLTEFNLLTSDPYECLDPCGSGNKSSRQTRSHSLDLPEPQNSPGSQVEMTEGNLDEDASEDDDNINDEDFEVPFVNENDDKSSPEADEEKSGNALLEVWKAEKQTFCEGCQLMFPVSYYADHVKVWHNPDLPHAGHVSLQEFNRFSCKICPSTFGSKMNLSKHAKIHETSPFHCYVCRKVYSRLACLKKHLKVCHQDASKEEQDTAKVSQHTEPPVHDEKEIRCQLCDDYQTSVSEFGCFFNHFMCCKGEKALTSLKCPFCIVFDTSSSNKSRFIEHVKMCHDTNGNASEVVPANYRVFECSICPEEKFFLVEEFIQHYTVHRTINLKCTRCPKRFSVTSCVVRHWKLHHPDAASSVQSYCKFTKLTTFPQIPWWCKSCGMKFTNESDRTAHILEFHEDVPKVDPTLICSKCIKAFDCDAELRLHEVSAHFETTKMLVCNICKQQFITKYRLNRHKQLLHPNMGTDTSSKQNPGWFQPIKSGIRLNDTKKRFVCHVCNSSFASAKYLRKHIFDKHHLNMSLPKPKPKVKSSIICETCNETFVMQKDLLTHRREVHHRSISKACVCDTCGKQCASEKTLKTHLELHVKDRSHPCEQCDQSFTTAPYLRFHVYREHTPLDPAINPLVCPHCNKVFRSVHSKRQHVEGAHKGKFPLHCDICGQGCYVRSALKRHKSRKHGIGSLTYFKCDAQGCRNKFLSEENLKLHKMEHLKGPTHPCKFCGKGFNSVGRRHRHEQIHTNAESKPYQCEICSKRFPVRNYLYIHMRSHRNDKP